MPRHPSIYTMELLWLLIPLAIVAIAIAVIPVAVGSFHQEHSTKEGTPANTRLATREANQRHAELGRRIRRAPHQLQPGRDATLESNRRSR